jgi:glycosyltransferase involved in cell wall biosynthesis
MVKNESDIIEQFVRHNRVFFDWVEVIDNGSSDDTLSILEALKGEFPDLTVTFDSTSEYTQAERMTLKYRQLVSEREFDFLVILDADEFLNSQDPDCLRNSLRSKETKYFLEWSNYTPTVDDDESVEDPIRRIRYRNSKKSERKVVLPNVGNESAKSLQVWQGNHNFGTPGRNFKFELLPFVVAHYPVRSLEQIQSKVAVGWLAYTLRDRGGTRSTQGFQWWFIYEKVVTDSLQKKDLTMLADNYFQLGRLQDLQVDWEPALVLDPIERHYADLKYMKPVRKPLIDVIRFSERLVEEIQLLKGQRAPLLHGSGTLSRISFRIGRGLKFLKKKGIGATLGKLAKVLFEKLSALGRGRKDEVVLSSASRELIEKHRTPLKALPLEGRQSIVFVVEKRHVEWQTTRYRIFNLTEGLRELGWNCGVLFLDDLDIDKVPKSTRIASICVFVRVEISQPVAQLVESQKRAGAVVVFDIDDLVFEDHPFVQKVRKNAVWIPELYNSDSVRRYRDQARRFREMIAKADFCTASTLVLSKRQQALGTPSYVIPNSNGSNEQLFAGDYRRVERENVVVVGYFCGSPTHRDDFLLASEALYQIMNENQTVELLVMGPLDLPEYFLTLPEGRVRRLPRGTVQEYLSQLGACDINLVPLEQIAFNDGKSELKIFEAALFGVPSVASLNPTTSACIDNGESGFLVGDSNDWHDALRTLVTDSAKRSAMGKKAKQLIAGYFDYRNISRIAHEAYSDMLLRKSTQ